MKQKRLVRKSILLGILLLSHWLVVAGSIYYIDAKGDDRQDGSRAHPWSTLAPGNRLHLQAGDSVFFRGGQSFTGTLKVDNGGRPPPPPRWVGRLRAGSPAQSSRARFTG